MLFFLMTRRPQRFTLSDTLFPYPSLFRSWWRCGGQLVSGAALPGSIGVRGVAGYAKAGGAFGGVYGFGSADGNLGDRLLNVPVNAGLGAGLGATLGKGVDLLAPMIGKGASKMRGFGRGASDSVPIAPVGEPGSLVPHSGVADDLPPGFVMDEAPTVGQRSEEHTSELQSLMRISYAVFCLKKKKQLMSN